MEGVIEKCQVCKDYSKQWIEHYYWNHLDLKRMSFIKFMKGNFSQHLPLQISSNSNNISSGSSSDSEYCGNRKGIGSLKASKIHFRQGFENTQREKLDDCVSYMKLRIRKGIGNSKASKIHFKQGSENTQREKLDNCISYMKLSAGEKKKAMELTRGTQSGNPFFVLVMRATYVKSYVNVPHDFARDYLPSSKTIVLQINGSKRKCPVNYIVQNKDSRIFGKWMTFVRDNNLKEGDICLFELVKGVKYNVIKVHISPKEPKPPHAK